MKTENTTQQPTTENQPPAPAMSITTPGITVQTGVSSGGIYDAASEKLSDWYHYIYHNI